MYFEAARTHSLARMQVEVGDKVARRIRRILHQNRITMVRFLTALLDEVTECNLVGESAITEVIGEGQRLTSDIATAENSRLLGST
jgi:hypothetical protein